MLPPSFDLLLHLIAESIDLRLRTRLSAVLAELVQTTVLSPHLRFFVYEFSFTQLMLVKQQPLRMPPLQPLSGGMEDCIWKLFENGSSLKAACYACGYVHVCTGYVGMRKPEDDLRSCSSGIIFFVYFETVSHWPGSHHVVLADQGASEICLSLSLDALPLHNATLGFFSTCPLVFELRSLFSQDKHFTDEQSLLSLIED